MRTFTAIALLLSSSLVFARPEREVHELCGEVVAIADGDTLTVLDGDKVQHKIRLAGIDAPEKGQAFESLRLDGQPAHSVFRCRSRVRPVFTYNMKNQSSQTSKS